ncbi:MAG: PKD domain-containing protein [Caldilineaceae bacterium]
MDGQLIIDDWTAAPAALTGRTPSLAAGEHDLRVEYVKTVGEGAIRLGWAPVQTPVTLPTAVITAPLRPGQPVHHAGRQRPRRARGRATSFAWDLGDGNASAGQIVQYGYTAPGVYTVSLTVTDAPGRRQLEHDPDLRLHGTGDAGAGSAARARHRGPGRGHRG